MGAQPQQQDAAGSGYTTQKTVLPEDIVNSSQSQFRSALSNAGSNTSNLNSLIPSYQSMSNFDPGSMSLQNTVSLQGRDTGYDLGQLHSDTLNPLIAGQLSQSYQDASGATQAQNARLASQLGGNNRALLASIMNENNMNSALSTNANRLGALQSQLSYDTADRNAAVQAAQLDLARMSQYNQSQLDQGNFANNATQLERQALERAYALNQQTASQNNSAYNQQFQNRLSANQQQQALLELLGKGLISTAPQAQANFTVDDLKAMSEHPEYYNPNLWGGGLLTPNQMSYLNGGSTPSTYSYVNPATSQQGNFLGWGKFGKPVYG